jgi:putative PIN family toxin of toxin-antitoxin system
VILAVLDANVLASGLAGLTRSASVPGEVVRRWIAGDFDLAISRPIANEVDVALGKPWFRSRVSEDARRRFLDRLESRAQAVRVLPPVVDVATYWHDDLVLATSVGAAADVLVTGDAGLLRLGRFQGVVVESSRAFLLRLDAGR